MAIRTKYGKNAQKTIYIAPGTQDEKSWQELIDYAAERREGIGSILMRLWRKFKTI
jgi:hypothetical protein